MSLPSPSTAQPVGISSPRTAATSILPGFPSHPWIHSNVTPAATAEVAMSRHMPLVSPGAENAIGFVDSTL